MERRERFQLRWGPVEYDYSTRELVGRCLDGTEFAIPATMGQIQAWLVGDLHIQDVFPELSPDQREILISGISPEQFERLFGEDDDLPNGYDPDEDRSPDSFDPPDRDEVGRY